MESEQGFDTLDPSPISESHNPSSTPPSRGRMLILRFGIALLAAIAVETANSLLGRFTVVTLEPLPAMAFLAGVLFGWPGILGTLSGQIFYRFTFLEALSPLDHLTIPLSYAPIGIAGYLAFRLVPRAGRGFPNARSYGALVAGGLAGGAVTALLFQLPAGGFLVLLASNLVSILLLGPPVMLLASRGQDSWWVDLPDEGRLPVPFPQNLDLQGQPQDLHGRLFLFLLTLVTITSVVVPLAHSTPQVGGWTLLGYLGLVVWAAMAHGLRGGLLATSFSGILYLAGRAYIDRDLLPDDPNLYAVGLYADFVVFSVVAVVVGAGREEECRLRQEMERREKKLRVLNEMADLLQASLNLKEAYAIVDQKVEQLLPGLVGDLSLMKDGDFLERTVRWGAPSGRSMFAPEDCWALRRGRPYHVGDTSRHPACAHIAPEAQDSFCVPLVAHGETLGVLHLEGSGRLPETHRALALSAGKQIALALANIQLRDSLRAKSIRDPLTGLFNRRYMNETLHREIHRARREDRSIAILIADIDHFKNFNDTYGHEAGDRVLQTLAEYLQTQARKEDIVCRWGGEEFVWVQLGADLQNGRLRAEEIRRGVQELTLDYEGHDLGPVTLSVGVASFPLHGASEETVMRAADAALYRAKDRGRNRVVVAQAPSAQGPRPVRASGA